MKRRLTYLACPYTHPDPVVRREHIMQKNNPTPVKQSAFLPEVEYIVLMRKPGTFFSNDAPFDLYRKVFVAAQRTGDAKLHPAEKPLVLMKKYLRILTPESGRVFDPFIGSGTTLRAAKDMGREAVGCDISEKCCELAALRCEQEVFEFPAR